MSPYTVRVGRDEIRLLRRRDAVKQMLQEVREQASYQHPRSVALYHYGELIAEW
jgi:hypothetical protein